MFCIDNLIALIPYLECKQYTTKSPFGGIILEILRISSHPGRKHRIAPSDFDL